MSAQAISHPPFSFRRVSRREPCPICGKPDWCSVRSDGAIHCMRTESARPARNGPGWWHRPDPFTKQTTHPYTTYKATYTKATHFDPSFIGHVQAPALVDSVYQSLLAACPLTAADLAGLAAAGIGNAQLAGFGSLPMKRGEVARALLDRFSRDELAGVPGFSFGPDGKLTIHALAGLLVASRDAQGSIRGMQCRVTEADGKRKYVWLSSTSTGGPSSMSPCHVARGADSSRVWITEGVKKSIVACAATGCTALAMAGHQQHEGALRELDALMSAGTLCVVLALDEDSDPATRNLVDISRRGLVAACLARGLAVRVARWDPADGKGIDDLLLAGKQPTIEIVTSAAEAEDPGKRQPGRRLSTQEEAARYRAIRRILWNSDRAANGPSMTAAEKLTLLCSYELADIYPGTVMAGASVEATPLNMGALAARVGCSPKLAGQHVQHLAGAGLIERKERYMDDTGHKQILLAPGRPLAFNEVLTPSPRREADRQRKRCSSCGSDRLTIRSVCLDCGTIEMIQHGDDREISVEKGPTEDSAIGTDIDQIPWDDPVYIDPLEDSAIGPLLEETDQSVDTSSRDLEIHDGWGSLAGKRYQPGADPWQCPCGGREWESSSTQQRMYCVACGTVYLAPQVWPSAPAAAPWLAPYEWSPAPALEPTAAPLFGAVATESGAHETARAPQ